MKMTDLKRPKPKKADNSGKGQPETVGSSHEDRPYCLRFTLEKPELDKLGLAPKSFSGMEPITATVLLDPITIRDNESKSNDHYNDNSNQSVEFQVMSIAFEAMKPKVPSKSEVYREQKNRGPE